MIFKKLKAVKNIKEKSRERAKSKHLDSKPCLEQESPQ